tara:strand:- start:524 stop:769 length:246 start_codon:yes stop_codon:yes gene_type:complete
MLVTVNLKMANSQQSVDVALAVLAERLESIEQKIDDLTLNQHRQITDLEQRVRTVEKWIYAVPASLLTAIIAAAITLAESL